LLLLLVFLFLLTLGLLLLLLVFLFLLTLGLLLLLLVFLFLLTLGLLLLFLSCRLCFLLLLFRLSLLLRFLGLRLLLMLLLLREGGSDGSEKKEQNSRADETGWFHICFLHAVISCVPRLWRQARLLCQFRSILASSTEHAGHVQDHRDKNDRPNYPQTSACPPSGIPVIAAASAEQ
jgi:hypothetical protein